MTETAPTGVGMTTCTHHAHQTQDAARRARAAREMRYSARSGMGLVTHVKNAKGEYQDKFALCGTPTGPNVLISKTASSAGYAGIGTCGSVHVCPVCAAKISVRRRQELHRVMVEWQRRGGDFIFMTLTVRHNSGQGLRHVWDGLASAWRAVTSSASWTREKARYGIRHYVRWTEVTHGKAGWHPHYHVLLFVDGGVSQRAADALGASIFSRWSTGAKKVGLSLAPVYQVTRNGQPEKVAIDTRLVRGTAADAGRQLLEIAEYLSKLGLYEEAEAALWAAQDANVSAKAAKKRAISGLASEITLGHFKGNRDSNKTGKRVSGTTPFAILSELLGHIEKEMQLHPADVRAQLKDAGMDDAAWLRDFVESIENPTTRTRVEWLLRLWSEWVRVSAGRRMTVWSRDLRQDLAPDTADKTDEELAAERGEHDDWVGKMSADTYRHLRTHRPAALGSILDAAGTADTATDAAAAVNRLLEGWGLPPLTPVTDDDVLSLGLSPGNP